MTITIDFPPDQYGRLTELARRHGLSAEDFARRELAERLDRDTAFTTAAGYVLAKNADLYRRLAR